MILSGQQIAKARIAGLLTIEPFDSAQLNPNSYNYRLGTSLRMFPEHTIFDSREPKIGGVSRPIPEEGIVLEPKRLYLGHTHEVIGSSRYVTSLIGRSSVGRLGLFLQVSANLGHQGSVHKWTLELTACLPIRIYPSMLIGQITFWEVSGSPLAYAGKYGNFNEETECLEPL